MSGSKHRLPIVHVIRVLLSYGGEKCTACLVITESGRRALLHGDKCRKAKSVLEYVITEELSLNLALTNH